MNPLHFGIDFIDKRLEFINEKGIYLFYEPSSYLRYSFFYHLLSNEKNLEHSCLLVASLDISFSSYHIRQKLYALNKHENLTILEIPPYLHDVVTTIDELIHVMNDLDVFIRTVNPEIIIIQNLDFLFNYAGSSRNLTLFPAILNHLRKHDALIIVDISFLDSKSKHDYQKFARGTFEIYSLNKNDNYEFLYRSSIKQSKDDFPNFETANLDAVKQQNSIPPIVFTYDSAYNITTPYFKNSYGSTLDTCKFVYLMKEFDIYENLFIDTFGKSIEFNYFSSMEQLYSSRIEGKHSLLFIPTQYNDVSGWALLQSIRRRFPECKIILFGTMNIRPAQKVRGMRLGADKYIVFPCSAESFRQSLFEVYSDDLVSQQRYLSHETLYSKEDFTKGFSSPNILRKSMSRFIKEYAYSMITQGNTLSFFKIIISDEDIDLNDFIKNNEKYLVYSSKYFVEQNKMYLMIFHKLSYKQQNKIINEILETFKPINEPVLEEPTRRNNFFSRIIRQSPKKEKVFINLKTINYPVEQPDIDVILDWLYYG